MGPQEDYIETVLTCEGDFYDPAFHAQLHDFSEKLEQLITLGSKKLVLKKVEPWNSVRVTFNIPKEAALRLKQLAQQRDNTLKALGILSVQVEGDQIISLTIAGKNNEPTELVFRTTSKASVPDSSIDTSRLDDPTARGATSVETTHAHLAQFLNQQGNGPGLYDSIFNTPSSSGEFKTPPHLSPHSDAMMVRPQVHPFTSPTERSPGKGFAVPSSNQGPFPPGRSPTGFQNINSSQPHIIQSGSGIHNPASPNYPTPPPSVSNPTSPGIRATGNFPVGLSGHTNPTHINNAVRMMVGAKGITSQSPLLVNLLQNDPAAAAASTANSGQHNPLFNNMVPPKLPFNFENAIGQTSPPQPKRKRKQKKPKPDKPRPSPQLDAEVSLHIQNILNTVANPDFKVDTERRLPNVPLASPSEESFTTSFKPPHTSPTFKPSESPVRFGRQIINPRTGLLETIEDDGSNNAGLNRADIRGGLVQHTTSLAQPLGQLRPPQNPLVALHENSLFTSGNPSLGTTSTVNSSLSLSTTQALLTDNLKPHTSLQTEVSVPLSVAANLPQTMGLVSVYSGVQTNIAPSTMAITTSFPIVTSVSLQTATTEAVCIADKSMGSINSSVVSVTSIPHSTTPLSYNKPATGTIIHSVIPGPIVAAVERKGTSLPNSLTMAAEISQSAFHGMESKQAHISRQEHLLPVGPHARGGDPHIKPVTFANPSVSKFSAPFISSQGSSSTIPYSLSPKPLMSTGVPRMSPATVTRPYATTPPLSYSHTSLPFAPPRPGTWSHVAQPQSAGPSSTKSGIEPSPHPLQIPGSNMSIPVVNSLSTTLTETNTTTPLSKSLLADLPKVTRPNSADGIREQSFKVVDSSVSQCATSAVFPNSSYVSSTSQMNVVSSVISCNANQSFNSLHTTSHDSYHTAVSSETVSTGSANSALRLDPGSHDEGAIRSVCKTVDKQPLQQAALSSTENVTVGDTVVKSEKVQVTTSPVSNISGTVPISVVRESFPSKSESCVGISNVSVPKTVVTVCTAPSVNGPITSASDVNIGGETERVSVSQHIKTPPLTNDMSHMDTKVFPLVKLSGDSELETKSAYGKLNPLFQDSVVSKRPSDNSSSPIKFEDRKSDSKTVFSVGFLLKKDPVKMTASETITSVSDHVDSNETTEKTSIPGSDNVGSISAVKSEESSSQIVDDKQSNSLSSVLTNGPIKLDAEEDSKIKQLQLPKPLNFIGKSDLNPGGVVHYEDNHAKYNGGDNVNQKLETSRQFSGAISQDLDLNDIPGHSRQDHGNTTGESLQVAPVAETRTNENTENPTIEENSTDSINEGKLSENHGATYASREQLLQENKSLHSDSTSSLSSPEYVQSDTNTSLPDKPAETQCDTGCHLQNIDNSNSMQTTTSVVLNELAPASSSLLNEQTRSSLPVSNEQSPGSLPVSNEQAPTSLPVSSEQAPTSLLVSNEQFPASLSVSKEETATSMPVSNEQAHASSPVLNEQTPGSPIGNKQVHTSSPLLNKDDASIIEEGSNIAKVEEPVQIEEENSCDLAYSNAPDAQFPKDTNSVKSSDAHIESCSSVTLSETNNISNSETDITDDTPVSAMCTENIQSCVSRSQEMDSNKINSPQISSSLPLNVELPTRKTVDRDSAKKDNVSPPPEPENPPEPMNTEPPSGDTVVQTSEVDGVVNIIAETLPPCPEEVTSDTTAPSCSEKTDEASPAENTTSEEMHSASNNTSTSPAQSIVSESSKNVCQHDSVSELNEEKSDPSADKDMPPQKPISVEVSLISQPVGNSSSSIDTTSSHPSTLKRLFPSSVELTPPLTSMDVNTPEQIFQPTTSFHSQLITATNADLKTEFIKSVPPIVPIPHLQSLTPAAVVSTLPVVSFASASQHLQNLAANRVAVNETHSDRSPEIHKSIISSNPPLSIPGAYTSSTVSDQSRLSLPESAPVSLPHRLIEVSANVKTSETIDQAKALANKILAEDRVRQAAVLVASTNAKQTSTISDPTNSIHDDLEVKNKMKDDKQESGKSAKGNISKGISILKPLYDKEADFDDDLEQPPPQKVLKIDPKETSPKTEEAQKDIENAKKGLAFKSKNINTVAKYLESKAKQQVAGFKMVTQGNIVHISQNSDIKLGPVKTVVKPHTVVAAAVPCGGGGDITYSSNVHTSHFVQKSLGTPTRINQTPHPIMAPGFHLDLTESVQKVMKPIPSSDTTPPSSPKPTRITTPSPPKLKVSKPRPTSVSPHPIQQPRPTSVSPHPIQQPPKKIETLGKIESVVIEKPTEQSSSAERASPVRGIKYISPAPSFATGTTVIKLSQSQPSKPTLLHVSKPNVLPQFKELKPESSKPATVINTPKTCVPGPLPVAPLIHHQASATVLTTTSTIPSSAVLSSTVKIISGPTQKSPAKNDPLPSTIVTINPPKVNTDEANSAALKQNKLEQASPPFVDEHSYSVRVPACDSDTVDPPKISDVETKEPVDTKTKIVETSPDMKPSTVIHCSSLLQTVSTIPSEVPKEIEPTKSFPKESEPTKSLPKESEPTKSVVKAMETTKLVPKESVPAKSFSQESEPAKLVPLESKPTKLVPKESEHSKSVPSESEPTILVPKEIEPKKLIPKEDSSAVMEDVVPKSIVEATPSPTQINEDHNKNTDASEVKPKITEVNMVSAIDNTKEVNAEIPNEPVSSRLSEKKISEGITTEDMPRSRPVTRRNSRESVESHTSVESTRHKEDSPKGLMTRSRKKSLSECSDSSSLADFDLRSLRSSRGQSSERSESPVHRTLRAATRSSSRKKVSSETEHVDNVPSVPDATLPEREESPKPSQARPQRSSKRKLPTDETDTETKKPKVEPKLLRTKTSEPIVENERKPSLRQTRSGSHDAPKGGKGDAKPIQSSQGKTKGPTKTSNASDDAGKGSVSSKAVAVKKIDVKPATNEGKDDEFKRATRSSRVKEQPSEAPSQPKRKR